jgi:hypothetical protein
VRAVIYSGGGGRWERRPAAMGPGKKEEGVRCFFCFAGGFVNDVGFASFV